MGEAGLAEVSDPSKQGGSSVAPVDTTVTDKVIFAGALVLFITTLI